MKRNGGDAIISSYFMLDGDPSISSARIFGAIALFPRVRKGQASFRQEKLNFQQGREVKERRPHPG